MSNKKYDAPGYDPKADPLDNIARGLFAIATELETLGCISASLENIADRMPGAKEAGAPRDKDKKASGGDADCG